MMEIILQYALPVIQSAEFAYIQVVHMTSRGFYKSLMTRIVLNLERIRGNLVTKLEFPDFVGSKWGD